MANPAPDTPGARLEAAREELRVIVKQYGLVTVIPALWSICQELGYKAQQMIGMITNALAQK